MFSSFFDQHPLTRIHPHPIYQHPLVGGYNPLYYHPLTDKEAPTSRMNLPTLSPPFLLDQIIEIDEKIQADSNLLKYCLGHNDCCP